ncbi:MAG: hypothetical protein K2Q10_05380 [Rhodospirillales bacterium]|nr:hypothetical protein [Rhodospirillales bacterium]
MTNRKQTNIVVLHSAVVNHRKNETELHDPSKGLIVALQYLAEEGKILGFAEAVVMMETAILSIEDQISRKTLNR